MFRISRVIPIVKIGEKNGNETKKEKISASDSEILITNDLSDTSKSAEVIFSNKLKVRMLIYNFQMGGKSGGNKNMINVPVKIEIKDNNLLSGSSKKKEYSSSSPAEKVIECRKSNKIKFEVKTFARYNTVMTCHLVKINFRPRTKTSAGIFPSQWMFTGRRDST